MNGIFEEPPKNDALKEIAKAVAIASISAALVGLINWGLEELKKKIEKPERKCMM